MRARPETYDDVCDLEDELGEYALEDEDADEEAIVPINSQ